MAAQTGADVASAYYERLQPGLGPMFERDDLLWGKIERSTAAHPISDRTMRIDLDIRSGGKFRYYSPDGGDMGLGGAGKRVEATMSALSVAFAIEQNDIVEEATDSQKKAIENVARKNLTRGMEQLRGALDQQINATASGILASMVSGAGTTTWVLDRIDGLYIGQDVSTYDSTLATKRAEEREILTIDVETKTLTVSGTVTGHTNTDVILASGLTGANPAVFRGLKYHHSNASTGTWQNLNRAIYPEVRTPRVNGNSGALVTSHVRLAVNKILKNLGLKSLQGQKGVAYLSVEQAHAWEQLGITISQIIRKSGGEQQPDLLFDEGGSMGGFPIMKSIHADPARIDFIFFKAWGRGVTKEIGFKKVGPLTVFPRYASGGGLLAAQISYLTTRFNIFNLNPRCGAYIDALLRPSGY